MQHGPRRSTPSVPVALRSGSSTVKTSCEHLRDRPEQLRSSHRAFASYARHDYRSLEEAWDFGIHDHILDAGGGTGELAFALLRAYPDMTATVMDLPEVIRQAEPPDELTNRCRLAAGDFFEPWQVRSDAVVLARVLHNWADKDAARILAACPRIRFWRRKAPPYNLYGDY